MYFFVFLVLVCFVLLLLFLLLFFLLLFLILLLVFVLLVPVLVPVIVPVIFFLLVVVVIDVDVDVVVVLRGCFLVGLFFCCCRELLLFLRFCFIYVCSLGFLLKVYFERHYAVCHQKTHTQSCPS